jgi:hypothetical protein
VLAVLTGLAIWKPVQLAPLTGLFGGYVWARFWHFMVMMALVVLGLGHVFMVFAVDPQSLRSMVTGRYDESRSPEALNARPFLRLKPKPAFTIARPAAAAPSPAPNAASSGGGVSKTASGDGEAVPVAAGGAPAGNASADQVAVETSDRGKEAAR